MTDKYEAVIGLEVHAQLSSSGKMFSGDANDYGRSPNTNITAITLAHPGTLPRINKRAIECAIRIGLACGCEISGYNVFDRKNYFYPDLPKGYQLTQDRTPICMRGSIFIPTGNGEKEIALNRIHLEEDAGKSIHSEGELTYVDLNRAGVPLIEIVTEPVIGRAEDAATFVSEVRRLVRYLQICDGNMEKGSLRCDANVSVRKKGDKILGKKVEIKNMNSLRNIEKAVQFEIDRQVSILDTGEEVISETRTFDAVTGRTFSMRMKEELNDYRYFPDPDVSPVLIGKEWIEDVKRTMPILPGMMSRQLEEEYQLPAYDARVLSDTRELAEYFMAVCKFTSNTKIASNWVMGAVKSYLNEHNIDIAAFPVEPKKLADVIEYINSGRVSHTMAQQRLFPALTLDPNASVAELAQRLNILLDQDSRALQPIVDDIIREFPLKVEQYLNGKKGIIAMFMGELMKRSKGKADPRVATELITKRLAELKSDNKI